MSGMLSIVLRCDIWPLKQSFGISRGSKTIAETLTVEIWDHARNICGRGACVPYARYNESISSVLAQLGAISKQLPLNLMPKDLSALLPAGAARNALDCALLHLRAQQAGVPVWKLLDLCEPVAVDCTATTISLDTADAMYSATMRAMISRHPESRIKIKLGGSERNETLEAARLRAVRIAAPQAQLIVDVNEGWNAALLAAMADALAETRVLLLEQPLPVGQDEALRTLHLPCPVFADESFHDNGDLPNLRRKYQGVNIKLDKTGGFTEALALRHAAQKAEFLIMVGCMVGSSLCMAPGILLAQGKRVIADLDGADLLAHDEHPALVYRRGLVYPPSPALWG